jgi:hypothetical protein
MHVIFLFAPAGQSLPPINPVLLMNIAACRIISVLVYNEKYPFTEPQ